MGRPLKFTREQLQHAALAMVDRHGVAGLTMRALAAEMGTGAMTLYNYVGQRAELEVLVVEAVIGAAKLPEPRTPLPDGQASAPADWRADVSAVATALWQAVRQHPQVIPLILTRRSRSPAMLRASERLLAALARSGRHGHRLLVAFRTVTAFLTGMAQAELAGPLAMQAGESAELTIARFRALPRDEFRYLTAIADAALASDADSEFARGLSLVLDGLAAAD